MDINIVFTNSRLDPADYYSGPSQSLAGYVSLVLYVVFSICDARNTSRCGSVECISWYGKWFYPFVHDIVVAVHLLTVLSFGNWWYTVGILPTFGPSWINMYGSVRQFKVVGGDEEELNEGIGDTTSFRGRLLVGIETTIIEGEMAGRSTVKREPLMRSSAVVSCMPQYLVYVTNHTAPLLMILTHLHSTSFQPVLKTLTVQRTCYILVKSYLYT